MDGAGGLFRPPTPAGVLPALRALGIAHARNFNEVYTYDLFGSAGAPRTKEDAATCGDRIPVQLFVEFEDFMEGCAEDLAEYLTRRGGADGSSDDTIASYTFGFMQEFLSPRAVAISSDEIQDALFGALHASLTAHFVDEVNEVFCRDYASSDEDEDADDV